MNGDMVDFIIVQKKYPRLTPDQELELARIVQTAVFKNHPDSPYHDPNQADGYEIFVPELDDADPRAIWAYQKMIQSNQGLVVKLAKKYRYLMPFEDLFQEGCIGLSRAVIKFDPSQGNRFSTYAYGWIRQAMTRSIVDKSRTIRIPAHIHDKIQKISNARNHLIRLNQPVSIANLAANLGWTITEVQNLIEVSQSVLSVDKAYTDKEGFELSDIIADEGNMFEDLARKESWSQLIGSIFNLALLTDREKEILWLRYGLDGNGKKTFKEVARSSNRSKQSAQSAERRAFAKVQNYLRKACVNIYDYLEESA